MQPRLSPVATVLAVGWQVTQVKWTPCCFPFDQNFLSGDASAVQSPTNSLALWMAAYRPHEGPPKATGEAPPSDTLSTRTLDSSSPPAGHVSSLHHPAPGVPRRQNQTEPDGGA
uniref:Uncharacterized protein n=1 Tax=Ixodes ricinus TaxID=34613 RepID=A0A6B0UKL7_IXORI